MNINTAISVLEITLPTDTATIKRAYRKKSSIHHPDKGGCEKKMQELNLAYETLANYHAVSKLDAIPDFKTRYEQRRQDEETLSFIGIKLFEFIDVEAITERLNIIFEDTFTVAHTEEYVNGGIYEKTLHWISSDRQKAMKLNAYISWINIKPILGSIANEAIDIPINSKLDLFADGRDIKLSKRRWLPTMVKSELFDVNQLLPLKKTRAAHEKNQKRAMKRIDSVSFLSLCCGFSKVSGKDTFQIRDKERGITLQASRFTSWGGSYSGSLFTTENNRSNFASSLYFFYEEDAYFCEEIRALVVQYQDCTNITECVTLSNQIKDKLNETMEAKEIAA